MSRHFVYCFVCNQEYPDKDGFTCQYCSERCYKMSRKKEIEALQHHLNDARELLEDFFKIGWGQDGEIISMLQRELKPWWDRAQAWLEGEQND